MRDRTILALSLMVLFTAGSFAAPQKKKEGQEPPTPRLVRDDRTEEAEALPGPAQMKPDPAKARKSLEVGLFYLRKKNYTAALERFREAVRFDPALLEAHLRQFEALEQKKDWEQIRREGKMSLEDPALVKIREKIQGFVTRAENALASTPQNP